MYVYMHACACVYVITSLVAGSESHSGCLQVCPCVCVRACVRVCVMVTSPVADSESHPGCLQVCACVHVFVHVGVCMCACMGVSSDRFRVISESFLGKCHLFIRSLFKSER